mmetsp:Transcript_21569/g.54327  ORF Transcript_21569/g.54327 Transcript_21569/m.54327 type:complete len:336 (+) Transcript_21569:172-1179(+)
MVALRQRAIQRGAVLRGEQRLHLRQVLRGGLANKVPVRLDVQLPVVVVHQRLLVQRPHHRKVVHHGLVHRQDDHLEEAHLVGRGQAAWLVAVHHGGHLHLVPLLHVALVEKLVLQHPAPEQMLLHARGAVPDVRRLDGHLQQHAHHAAVLLKLARIVAVLERRKLLLELAHDLKVVAHVRCEHHADHVGLEHAPVVAIGDLGALQEVHARVADELQRHVQRVVLQHRLVVVPPREHALVAHHERVVEAGVLRVVRRRRHQHRQLLQLGLHLVAHAQPLQDRVGSRHDVRRVRAVVVRVGVVAVLNGHDVGHQLGAFQLQGLDQAAAVRDAHEDHR